MKNYIRTLSSINVIKTEANLIALIEAKDIDDEALIMVVEYANLGTLESYIIEYYPEGLKELHLFYFFFQIFSALKNIHLREICLKNFSPKNILIKDFELKISKFSESIEICNFNKNDSNFWKKIDVFCLGNILYFMIFASYPFKSSELNFNMSILDLDHLIENNQRKISGDLKLMLIKLLANSDDRFFTKDIENCKWYNVNYQKYLKITQHYPNQTHEFYHNYFSFEK